MKRLTFLGAGLGSGGAEHQVVYLMNMLVEKGYDVTYASFGDVKDHYYVCPNIKRIQLAPNRTLIIKIFSIIKFLLFIKSDVIFAFSQRMSVLTLFPMLFRKKIKVISSERNFTISEPDIYEKILVNTKIYSTTDYIVPNSFSQGRYLAKIMPSIKDKIHVVTNYTDIWEYKYSPLPQNSMLKVGILCRYEKQKNFVKFIEVLRQLKMRDLPDFHVYWYGNYHFSNPMQIHYFEEGLSKIKECALDTMITINDATNNVANLIPTFDVMCLPSLYEGFSNSISEYICCGRPVLCSDVSDNSIMVHDGENGYLFDPNNVDSIVNAFVSYFNLSEQERAIMGRKSRTIAESLFDKNTFINSYINIIEH